MERNWGKADRYVLLLHVLQVGFGCTVVVINFKYANPHPDRLAIFPAVWLVSPMRANSY